MKESTQILWLLIIAALMLFIRSDAFPKLMAMVIEFLRGLGT